MRLTASGVGLALRCAWSFRDDAVRADFGDRWIEHTAAHEAIDRTIQTGDESCEISIGTEAKLTDGQIATVRAKHTAWVADFWHDQKWREWAGEQAYAFDPVSGDSKLLHTTGHRDYSACPDGWIPGTADAIAFDGDRCLIVDWKCGHSPPGPEDNSQLAMLSLAMGREDYGTEVAIAHVREDGVRTTWSSFDALDLSEWRRKLRDLMERIPASEPTPGDHCRDLFCASYGLCPATSSALEVVAPDAKRRLPVVYSAADIDGPDHAQQQYHALRAAKAAFESAYGAAFEALRVWADANGGVPVGNGKTWMRSERRRESVDLADMKAVEAIRGVLGDDWLSAVSFESSKTAIKRAARSFAQRSGETITEVETRVLKALRQAGAIRVRTTTNFEEVVMREVENG